VAKEEKVRLPFKPAKTLPKEDRHNTPLISIRVTSAVKAAVDSAAEGAGISRNAWIVDGIKNRLRRLGFTGDD